MGEATVQNLWKRLWKTSGKLDQHADDTNSVWKADAFECDLGAVLGQELWPRVTHSPLCVWPSPKHSKKIRFLHLFLPSSFSARRVSSPRSPRGASHCLNPRPIAGKDLPFPGSQFGQVFPGTLPKNPVPNFQNSVPNFHPSQPTQTRGQSTEGQGRWHLPNLTPQVPLPARDFSAFLF